MKKKFLVFAAIQLGIYATALPLLADQPVMSTPPVTDAEREAAYAAAIEYRVNDIVVALKLGDQGKAAAVHDILVVQYHDLRVRDAAIDTRLRVDGKAVNYANRAEQLSAQSKPLHEKFLAQIGTLLMPDQIEKVKDLMTYNKVKVTYDAYCAMVPGLTDAEKAKVLELLKAAREEAMDGGNAPEKSEIFQKFKGQINAYLDSQGHDTAKAFQEWALAHPEANNPAK